MAFLEWQEIFETGIEEVDNQHQHLLDVINHLDELYNSGREVSESEINEALEQLFSYTDYHFESEERIMREIRYSDQDKHKHQHQDLIARLTSKAEKLRCGAGVTCPELLAFLSDWAINHIMTEDTKIGAEYRDYYHLHAVES